MIITIAAQNLLNGGIIGVDGKPEDRWPLLVKRIESIKPRPDLLLVSEVQDWDKQGHRQLSRAIHDLGMDALPIPPSNSGKHVALFYRRESVGRWKHWNVDYAKGVTHGFGVAAFDVGLPQLLSVVPVHLDPFSQNRALTEIQIVATRGYRYGPFAVIGGDINYAPAQDPEPDFKTMRPYNRASRTALKDPAKSGELESYRRISWALEAAGYVDVARHLYEQTKSKKYLKKTADGEYRIDQFWVTEPLAPAVTSYEVLDKPVGASDHKGIVFRLDTDKVDTTAKLDYS